MLHAKHKWKEAVDVSLWPYAMFTYNEQSNILPDKLDGSSKLERFSKVEVASNLKSCHTWGCPVFVLNVSLQNQNKISKWTSRARVGIYLGNSPKHARTVSLVLNLNTGHVSPQYHVQHDDFFETIQDTSSALNLGRWKQLAGIQSGETKPSSYGQNTKNKQEILTHDIYKPSANVNGTKTINTSETDDMDKELNTVDRDSNTHVEETNSVLQRSKRNRKMLQRMKESILQGYLAEQQTKDSLL